MYSHKQKEVNVAQFLGVFFRFQFAMLFSLIFFLFFTFDMNKGYYNNYVYSNEAVNFIFYCLRFTDRMQRY